VGESDNTGLATLIDVAAEFSPRCEITGPCQVTLDLSGLARLFGSARAIADELQRTAASRDLRVRIAIAGTATAARLLAHGAPHDITVVDHGGEADALASLPLGLLATDADALATFRKWGLRTLGDIAQLPSDAVAARLGQAGIRWQRLARGEDPRPLLPAVPEERFEQALDLEWPIEGLEPLSFVLGRLIEVVSGKPYPAFVQEKIFDPLGMRDTTYHPRPSEAGRMAALFQEQRGVRRLIYRVKPEFEVRNPAPDGGIFSTVRDMAKFDQMFLDNDGRVLARAHARSGDAAMVAGYLGKHDTFERAMSDFAMAYTAQNALDHRALIDAVESGRIEARAGL
jgi:hypothetical protein